MNIARCIFSINELFPDEHNVINLKIIFRHTIICNNRDMLYSIFRGMICFS